MHVFWLISPVTLEVEGTMIFARRGNWQRPKGFAQLVR